MEERYLFKAKREDNKEWIFGSYAYAFVPDKKSHIYGLTRENHVIVEQNGNIVLIDKDTLCQCTGLKDKNGNLIWENDIVKVKYSDNFEEITEVAYTKNGYYPYSDEYECEGCCCYREVLTIEVIGNIFDNPELLESER